VPREVIACSRFFRSLNPSVCGRTIRSPNRHLNRNLQNKHKNKKHKHKKRRKRRKRKKKEKEKRKKYAK
jgi:hypothetical protein